MPVPNDGTTNLPSDAGSRYFLGIWDAANSVFRAWHGDSSGNANVNVKYSKATAVVSDVSVTTTSGTLLAANASRLTAIFKNAGNARIYLTQSSPATSINFPLDPGESFEDEYTTGAWYAIAASGTVDVRLMEIS